EVCGEAEDADAAVKLLKKKSPDFAIVDITLKNSSGIDLIKDMRQLFPALHILTLSMHDELIYAERALRAGAKGYVMKQEAPETIVTAIRHILKGNTFFSDNVTTRLFSRIAEGGTNANKTSPVDLLSDRELEIFQMIGRGFSSRQISGKLHISIKTVENHRARIKEKLNLSSAIELVQHATLWVQKDI
ncbi:MAG: response regulator transcription factor, partial [Spirochaetes bacterium]|nr:response regulator transcription factor [Spirochaetota bacterium]